MSELIRQGIERANEDLKKENDQKLIQQVFKDLFEKNALSPSKIISIYKNLLKGCSKTNSNSRGHF